MGFTDKIGPRSSREWFSSLPVLLLLLSIIIAGNSESIHSQLLKTGGVIWDGYFLLRMDLPTPDCNQNPDMESELDILAAEMAEDDDGLGLFDDDVFDREAARVSLHNARDLCRERHQIAKDNLLRVTPAVKAYRAVETNVAKISVLSIKTRRITLLMLVFICAITSTIARHHIAFRPMESVLDHRVSSFVQFLGNSILTFSCWSFRENVFGSGTVVDHPQIYNLLVVGFMALSFINLYQLIKIPADAKPGGSPFRAFLSIPLYILMAFSAGNYFILTEGNASGIAIFFSQIFEQSGIFLKIGLYIWIGMLLKQTRLGTLVFDIFKPWHLPPELLAFVAIVVMAVPTAITGASGIIIIALGVVVYDELRRVGARRQLAFAATAMTGSAGVVLRPCLMIVIIAALNKEVVTNQLYSWGVWVFLLSSVVFFIFAFITKKEKLEVRPAKDAIGPCIQACKPLIPYVVIIISVAVIYAMFLNLYLDEFSAPIILPVMILAILAYEKIYLRAKGVEEEASTLDKRPKSFEGAVRAATTEATVHIGALIILMGLSFAVGGVIERSGIFDSLPEVFGSIWITLGFLLVVLVGIGMIMDPFGAIFLVSGTVAHIAYSNGVHPVHFWMIALVAFELGYLSPPVALNHLLTRQVVGEEEAMKAEEEVRGEPFWYRHERILLPLVVMGTTLLIVAIGPILVGYS